MKTILPSSVVPSIIFGCVLIAAMVAFAAESGQKGGADALIDCIPSSDVEPLASETASASTAANLLSEPDSIRVASHRMLTSALDTARSKEPVPWIIFTSTPELPEKSDADVDMCAHHEQMTQKEPLEFEERRFATADELIKWIMDFTRGKGEDGRSLYKQCPGKCSPQYTWWIEPLDTGMNVRTRVVCGLPRDRKGNMYHLTTGIARACPVVEK